jgi:succinate dehydrogenase / fumarate reductase, membrane anchor subunit
VKRAASTPLGLVLGGGAAHSGPHHWWMQRVSAVALLPLTAWFIVALLWLPDLSWASVHLWIAGPWSALAMVMLVLALCWHSHLGVQVVIEDYIHGPAIKTFALLLAGFAHMAAAGTALLAVLRITLAASP